MCENPVCKRAFNFVFQTSIWKKEFCSKKETRRNFQHEAYEILEGPQQ